MATEPADVLIVGAGAAGGVVARRLAEAGFTVVCLEQGRWHDRGEYRGNQLDWELTMRKQWSTSPNVRGLPDDYPIDERDAEVSPLMFSAVGGSIRSKCPYLSSPRTSIALQRTGLGTVFQPVNSTDPEQR